MQKKTAVSLATLALMLAIAGTGVAAATIASPDAASDPVRPAGTSTVVQTTVATDDDGWPGQLPDAERFPTLSHADQQAVLHRVDRLLGDLGGSQASAGLVAELSSYRSELARLRR